jgi:hypothetical protein
MLGSFLSPRFSASVAMGAVCEAAAEIHSHGLSGSVPDLGSEEFPPLPTRSVAAEARPAEVLLVGTMAVEIPVAPLQPPEARRETKELGFAPAPALVGEAHLGGGPFGPG